MRLGVSIIICSHNSANRLPETLRHLAAQQVSITTPWELIVVDNASTDETAYISKKLWERADVPLLVVSEPQPGLSHARICGVRAATHEIISFIDDDNWVSSNWVEILQEIFAENPAIGAVGGKSVAAFESPPPNWFHSIEGYYAVGKPYPASRDITDGQGTLLWGAGLSFRKTAIAGLFNNDFQFLLSGRSGSRLLAGEDTEMCFALRETGWRLRYDDRLQLTHSISTNRLNWNYARNLMRGMGHASVMFNIYLMVFQRQPFGPEVQWFKKTWEFQMLKAIKDLVKLFFSHPIDCLSSAEGSHAVLQFEKLLGSIHCLLEGRLHYQSLINQIKRSIWIKPQNVSG